MLSSGRNISSLKNILKDPGIAMVTGWSCRTLCRHAPRGEKEENEQEAIVDFLCHFFKDD